MNFEVKTEPLEHNFDRFDIKSKEESIHSNDIFSPFLDQQNNLDDTCFYKDTEFLSAKHSPFTQHELKKRAATFKELYTKNKHARKSPYSNSEEEQHTTRLRKRMEAVYHAQIPHKSENSMHKIKTTNDDFKIIDRPFIDYIKPLSGLKSSSPKRPSKNSVEFRSKFLNKHFFYR